MAQAREVAPKKRPEVAVAADRRYIHGVSTASRTLLLCLSALALTGCLRDLRELRDGLVEEEERIDAGIGTVLVAPECGELPTAGFLCGGDPRGVWTIVSACPAGDTYDPLDGTCDDLTATASGSTSGIVTILSDGTIAVQLDTQTVEADFAFALSCYGGSELPCVGSVFEGSCAVDGDVCRCQSTRTSAPIYERGRWTRQDGALTVLGDDFTHVYDFCRMGPDVLALTRPSIDGDVAWSYILERAPEAP